MEGYPPPDRPVTPASDPAGEPVPLSGSYQRPAEYYETPGGPKEKSGCPRWLLYGCGGLGCLGLLLIVGIGIWMSRGGAARATTFVVSTLERDAEKLYTDDVPAEDRQALRQELAKLKDHIRSEQVDLMQLQPILSQINGSIRDGKLTGPEVDSLIESLRETNDQAGERPVSVRNLSRQGLTPV